MSTTQGSPPQTMTIRGDDWNLQQWLPSETSVNNTGPITDDERSKIEQLKRAENDGLYNVKNSQRGNALETLYCASPECSLVAKVVRWEGTLCIYTRNVHSNHNVTPAKGLKQPARKYVMDNLGKPQQQLLADLRRKGLDNSSQSDDKMKQSIRAKRDSLKKQGADNIKRVFESLDDLRDQLDARKQSIDVFISGVPLLPVDEKSPLRKVVILSHDVGENDDDWSEIILTFPSVREMLQKAVELCRNGLLQLEIDYKVGMWEGNRRQVGMVGITDRAKVFHVLAVAIHKSEDGQGSSNLLGMRQRWYPRVAA